MRIYNFNPGPAALPEPVLEKAREALWEVPGAGAGIAEISHRSAIFEGMLEEIQARLRRLLELPDDFSILFCQGGARMQFAMIPMNFLHGAAAYVDTGTWSHKAIEDAQLSGQVRVVASSEADGFRYIPDWSSDLLRGDESYLHITSNNTIYGTQWHQWPDPGEVPLIVDMSSDIASTKVDYSKFDMVYAGAQKNIGPAGITLVLLKQSFAERAKSAHLPMMLRYQTFIDSNSLYNTPPVFNIYMVGLVLEWIEEAGGIEGLEVANRAKAALLYELIDANPAFFRGVAREDSRSLMNITFNLPTPELEKQLVAEAKKAGFLGIKGHRSVGGIRVSNYNAVPHKGVVELVEHMKAFALKHGEG